MNPRTPRPCRLFVTAAACCLVFAPCAPSASAALIDLAAGANAALSSTTIVGTAGPDVVVLSANNLVVQSIVVKDVWHVANGTLKASIWEVVNIPGIGLTGSLVGQASTAITQITSGSVLADVTFNFVPQTTLVSGKKYRLGIYFPPTGTSAVFAVGTIVPPFIGGFPYTESTGQLKVTQAFRTGFNSFPTNFSSNFPRIELNVVPEPATLSLVGLCAAVRVSRRPRR
jgi:PEP-CTERM motif